MSTLSSESIPIDIYTEIVGEETVRNAKEAAQKLAGRTVCHVNSTFFGGGVAEILHRLVPLMRGVGLKVEWKVIKGSDEFFNATKAIHNGLQGMKIPFTEQMHKIYSEVNKANATDLDLSHDFVVIHDPQPAAMITYLPKKRGKWIWRCHIDLSHPNPEFIDFIVPFVLHYDALIFTMKQYVPMELASRKLSVNAPIIDPLSDKNKPLPDSLIQSILKKFDINQEKPIITQVSRFDPWKDPLGVIDTYRLVKKEVPDVQLLLIASMAGDDPEGWKYYERTARYAGNDYDIFLLTDLVGVGDTEVNAFQRASNVVLQKSLREGFGLSITEAMWKRIAVVGGNVGGVPLQILDGQNGFLVNNVEEAAEKCVYLLRHTEEAKVMGENGREHVRKNFLITRALKDCLGLFSSLEE